MSIIEPIFPPVDNLQKMSRIDSKPLTADQKMFINIEPTGGGNGAGVQKNSVLKMTLTKCEKHSHTMNRNS